MEPKIPDLGIFGLEFENNIFILQISTLEFVLLQNFEEKQKCLNVGRKMLYLGTFDQKCFIWVFSNKNVSFGYFCGRILKMLLSYLKSAPSNLSNCKILQKKTKIPKFGTKNALYEYLWARILKNYCHI